MQILNNFHPEVAASVKRQKNAWVLPYMEMETIKLRLTYKDRHDSNIEVTHNAANLT